MKKEFLLRFIPEIALDVLSLFKNDTKWRGNYASWDDAVKHSLGYDNDAILSKVINATKDVIDGKGYFERDSIVFDKPEYSWQLLSALLWIANQKNKLHLIDFGGAFGSSYYQNKKFLAEINDLKWLIVEQKNFIETGKKHFENETIKFYENIDSCLKDYSPSVVLLSSVLQYIDKPYDLIDVIGSTKIEYLIVDLTAITTEPNDRLTVQKVTPKIYDASYPCWFFNEENLKKSFEKHFHIVEEFNSYIGQNMRVGFLKRINYRGYILKNKHYDNN
ncbi:MAG: methyltransferase, TIGR04325 family [Bacteroidota bacterium]